MRKLWIPLALATAVSLGLSGAAPTLAQDNEVRVADRSEDDTPWGLLGLLGLAGLMGLRRKDEDRTHTVRTSPVTR